MTYKKRQIDLEAIVSDTLENGPREALKRAVTELQKGTIRLHLDEAEEISKRLRERGLSIQPYDFQGTIGVWEAETEEGVPYTQIAMKELISAVAAREQVDYRTVEGFSKMLPYFTAETLRTMPINVYGTRLNSILKKGISGLVMPLVNKDEELKEIKKEGLEPHDLPEAPQNYWIDKKRKPTDNARRTTGILIARVAELRGVNNHIDIDNFRVVIPYLTAETFHKQPLNIWETTARGMLFNAYKDTPYLAVRDWAEHNHPQLLQAITPEAFSKGARITHTHEMRRQQKAQ